MATIQELQYALSNARKADDIEAISVLEGAIRQAQTTLKGPPPRPGETQPKFESVGLAQQWRDANDAFNKLFIEYGPGAFTTVGATIKGAFDAFTSDAKYGSPEFAQIAKESTDKANEAMLSKITPKLTPNGQRIYDYLAEKSGDVMMAMMSNPNHINEGGGHYLADVTNKVLTKSPEVYKTAKNAGAKTIQTVKQAMQPKPEFTPEQVAKTQQRQEAATNLPEPIQLTKGQATNAFEEQQFEQTAAKTVSGDELRRNAEIQNMQLSNNLDMLIHDVGAKVTEPQATGGTVREAITQHKINEAKKVQESYTKAMESEEGNSPVILNDTINYLNENKTIATDIPVLKIMSQKAIDYGVAMKDAQGNLIPLETTLNKAEDFRKSISSNTQQTDNRDIFYSSQLKNNFTVDTETAGGDLYANARSKYTEFKNKFEKQQIIKDILSNKTSSNDKMIATENIFKKSILGGTAQDIANLKKTLLYAGDEGKSAWQNLQGTLLRYIKEEATKNVARDTAGNPIFSAARINQIVKDLEHGGRLEILLGKDGADVVRTVNDVAKHVLVSPPGTVNYSNTAPILAAMLDVGASAFSGVPAPIASVGRYVWQSIKDKKLQARIQKSLNFSPKTESTYKKPSFGIKETAKEQVKTKPTKEEVKAKVEAKKEEKEGKKKVSTEQQEARDLHKEVKNNQYLETYKDLILDEGKAKTKGERNQSHNWFDVPVEDDFGQTVATKRIAGQRDITEAFTADSAAINRFMNGKATVEDLRAINHDLKTFEMSSDLRDEAAMKNANKTNESVELSDGSIYDPVSDRTYTKQEWTDLQNESMLFSKSKPNEVEKYKEDIRNIEKEYGNIDDLSYNMMDISNRELTRLQRAKQTISEIKDNPEDAIHIVPNLRETLDNKTYRDELLKYSKINPEINFEKGTVKIYRSATGNIEAGDWIGLNRKYAQSHSRTKAHKVYSMEVPFEDIRWQGADMNEWIYLPQKIVDSEVNSVLFSKDKKTTSNERLTEWHKDSAPETKNEDGSPKVFYHGTGADFDIFKKGEKAGALGKGIYFTDDSTRAGGYTSINGKQENIMPVYLNMKKPFMVESTYKIPSVTALKKEKYDGLIWHSKGADGKVYSEYVVFNPNQIKSIHNKGTFSETNPNILMSKFKTKDSTTKAEAQSIAKDLLGKHYAKHADTFEIVQSIDDLPQNIKDALYSIQAYHGTPHNVDKFSTKYIGTGEGAQAYGYGMYFAGDKQIADWYRNSLSDVKYYSKGRELSHNEAWAAQFLHKFDSDMKAKRISLEEAISHIDKTLKDSDTANQIKEYAKQLDKDGVTTKQGNLYKVELKPKQEELLDWDEPLSGQSPQIKKALRQALGKARYSETDTGGYVYKHILQGGFADEKGITKTGQGASDYLRSLGIKGIKYLDATSRSKQEGSHNYNYVIFADEDIGKPEVLMSGGKPRGIFDPKTGKAYIIADAMKSNEVEGVILHELLHKNINNEVKAGKSRAEAIMGSRYESVVKRLDNLYKMGDKQVKEAFQKVTDANTPAQHRIEEVMTYLLENITNESKPLLIKWKDDVIQAIKAFIAKVSLQLGMKAETVMSKLDSKDIANILRSEAIKNESMLKNIKR